MATLSMIKKMLRTPEALRYLPPSKMDAELMLALAAKDYETLRFVCYGMWKDGFAMEVASRLNGELNPKAFMRIPEEFRTREVCLEAVSRYGACIRSVPEGLVDEEMCLAAVRQHGLAIRGIPKHLRTEQVCAEAVKNDPSAIDRFCPPQAPCFSQGSRRALPFTAGTDIIPPCIRRSA